MLNNLNYIIRKKKISSVLLLPKKFHFIHKNYIKTSIFKDDDIYIDPLEIHNEQTNKTNYLNCGNSDECVYNRSNVGMSAIIINNKYINIELINKLYKILRNSEVNYTKRFVFLTSLYNDTFNYSYNLYDILKILEIYQKTKNNHYLNILKKILININELAYLIFSYKKPFISYCNGKIQGSGGFLTFLANNSSSYFHSSYSYNNLSYSFLPYGGISYILTQLRGSLGLYLALTGLEIESSDLIWSGLCKRWISDDSLELMEITSESQLEVSPLATHITFEILNILRNYKIELLKRAQITNKLWNDLIKNSYKIAYITKEEISMAELKKTIDNELFIKALNLETNALLNFVSCPDILNGITSYLVKNTDRSFNSNYINNNIFEVKKDIIQYFIFYKNNYEYSSYDRPDISLSSLSVLDKYNQNYNSKHGNSHDKMFYQNETIKWSDDYLKDELNKINDQLL